MPHKHHNREVTLVHWTWPIQLNHVTGTLQLKGVMRRMFCWQAHKGRKFHTLHRWPSAWRLPNCSGCPDVPADTWCVWLCNCIALSGMWQCWQDEWMNERVSEWLMIRVMLQRWHSGQCVFCILGFRWASWSPSTWHLVELCNAQCKHSVVCLNECAPHVEVYSNRTSHKKTSLSALFPCASVQCFPSFADLCGKTVVLG